MGFHDQQEHARQATARLLVLFGLAVVFLCVGLYGALVVGDALIHNPRHHRLHIDWWHPTLLLWTTLGTAIVVASASWSKMRALDAGGGGIALGLGARQILAHTTDPAERRLLHVVEEMAIASGVRVPFVFCLDHERGINAFAAGFSPADAAITVTRGCLEQLDRDQLQGVIAHEFSHILNGDMGLNVRLVGILYGILFVGQTGLLILRASSGPSRRSGFGPGMLAGALLAVLGYVGVFFGRLIRAAVCRQREFLADASAVQFTRNPLGIAGALATIARHEAGSRVDAPQAEELAHLFFGQAQLTTRWRRLWATHPNIATRIERILPGGERETARLGDEVPQALELDEERALVHAAETRRAAPSLIARPVRVPQDQHIACSRELLAAIPTELRQRVAEPLGAMAAVLALLLDAEPPVRARQLAHLRTLAQPWLEADCLQLAGQLSALDARLRLPLVELAVPALRLLSATQFRSFVGSLQELAQADGQRSVFEYALQRLLMRRLVSDLGKRRRTPSYSDDAQLERDGDTLLSALAWAGAANPAAAQRAFEAGAQRLLTPGAAGLGLMPAEDAGFGTLDAALDRLPGAPLRLRLILVDACAHVALADGTVTAEQAQLLRSVADALDCPIPPFIA